MRCLQLSALTLSIFASACKTTPPILTDIGDAVDRGAKKVVGAFDGRSLPPPDEGEEEAVTRAREAYDAGKLAYQTAQYIDAVDRFLESFAAAEEIEDAELKAQVQSSLYYNLGSAQLKAYDLDKDQTRLGQAKALLQNYLDSDPGLSDEERDQALALMQEADDTLAQLDGPAESESGAEEG